MWSATNRKIALDVALERRITLKIEFERPDQPMRREIWKKLLPEEMPVGPDVDLDNLSQEDLSGGEIKNVILNAARLSLQRDCQGGVVMNDFLRPSHWSAMDAGANRALPASGLVVALPRRTDNRKEVQAGDPSSRRSATRPISPVSGAPDIPGKVFIAFFGSR